MLYTVEMYKKCMYYPYWIYILFSQGPPVMVLGVGEDLSLPIQSDSISFSLKQSPLGSFSPFLTKN